MQINKPLLLIVYLISCSQYLIAEDLELKSKLVQDKNIIFYVGINPLALVGLLPNNMGVYGTGYGIFSNQEFGISLYGGIIFEKSHSIEMRFSTGTANTAIWDTQLEYIGNSIYNNVY